MSYNLNENLKRSASKFPESIAYIYRDESVTYQELNQKVDRLAAGLYVQGIRKGDGVALILGNSPEFLIAFHGILRLGAFVVPINPLYTQGEINYLLDNSQAKAVITHVSVEQKLSEVKKQLKNLKLVVYTEAEDHNRHGRISWKQAQALMFTKALTLMRKTLQSFYTHQEQPGNQRVQC